MGRLSSQHVIHDQNRKARLATCSGAKCLMVEEL